MNDRPLSERRPLGRSDPQVSPLCLGGNVFGHGHPRGWAVLDAVRAVAGRHGATPAQVALAWLLGQPAVVAPIASATSAEQLRELIGFTRLRLDPADLSELQAP